MNASVCDGVKTDLNMMMVQDLQVMAPQGQYMMPQQQQQQQQHQMQEMMLANMMPVLLSVMYVISYL